MSSARSGTGMSVSVNYRAGLFQADRTAQPYPCCETAHRVQVGAERRDRGLRRRVQPRAACTGTGLAVGRGMTTTSSTMTSGDCLVVERADGKFDVYKVWAEGARQCVRD